MIRRTFSIEVVCYLISIQHTIAIYKYLLKVFTTLFKILFNGKELHIDQHLDEYISTLLGYKGEYSGTLSWANHLYLANHLLILQKIIRNFFQFALRWASEQHGKNTWWSLSLVPKKNTKQQHIKMPLLPFKYRFAQSNLHLMFFVGEFGVKI